MIKSFTLLFTLAWAIINPAYADPKAVSTASLKSLLKPFQYSVAARVIAPQFSHLHSQISANVVKLHFSDLDKVNQGDLLIELDCSYKKLEFTQQQSTIALLKEQLKFSKSQYERAVRLKKTNNIADEIIEQRQSEYQQFKHNIEANEAQLAILKKNIQHCQIIAPITGQITMKNISLGEYITPAQQLLQITNIEKLEVQADLNPDQIQSINDDIRFVYADKDYPLSYHRHSQLINPQSNTQDYRFLFGDKKALSGSSGRIIWDSQKFYISSRYLLQRDQLTGIFLAEDNKAVFYPLKNALPGQDALIELDPDTLVIIAGRHQLEDGDKIIISKPE